MPSVRTCKGSFFFFAPSQKSRWVCLQEYSQNMYPVVKMPRNGVPQDKATKQLPKAQSHLSRIWQMESAGDFEADVSSADGADVCSCARHSNLTNFHHCTYRMDVCIYIYIYTHIFILTLFMVLFFCCCHLAHVGPHTAKGLISLAAVLGAAPRVVRTIKAPGEKTNSTSKHCQRQACPEQTVGVILGD